MKKHVIPFAIILFLLFAEITYAQLKTVQNPDEGEENLNVLTQWIRWNNPGSLLINHLIKEADNYYSLRDKEIAGLKNGDDWRMRQEQVKNKLNELVGPFPGKTPLNPKVTGVIRKKGFRIEKIIYESMPEFYVTGCLFVPDGIKGKAPAILNVIGHNQESFRAELYQTVIHNLVKKGIIVFAIDPPGQGEHIQYYDPSINFSSIGYSVIEHCYFGNQCFLTGSSAARYFIQDGIRAIDYLLTLKYVDPERIGVTGFSGGGTISSYLAAFDDRIKVSVPCSWATASRRQLETKGAQDAETEIINGVSEGITLEDLLEVRAPKPALLTFVSRDEYLSLQGAREAFREALNAYEALGVKDNLELVEDDSKHWMTPKIRTAIYGFFMKHFNLKGSPEEEPVEILSSGELTVTPTGQISTSYGGKMIFDVNRDEAEKHIENLKKARKDPTSHLKSVQVRAKEISGFIQPVDIDTDPFINGRYRRDGYHIEKLALKGEGDYIIPFLLFIPHDDKVRHDCIIYLHPDGKDSDAKPGEKIEQLVKNGYIVAAVDPLGTGETKNTATRDLAQGYTALLLGRSIVGIQAADICRVAQYLQTRDDIDTSGIGALGINEICLPLIHAAAFDKSIKNVILSGSLISYSSVAMNRFYRIGLTEREGGGTHHPYEVGFSWGIAGVLKGYDLPDLIACISPRKVVLTDLKNQMLEPASDELIKTEMEFPRSVYTSHGAGENLRMLSGNQDMMSGISWCFN